MGKKANKRAVAKAASEDVAASTKPTAKPEAKGGKPKAESKRQVFVRRGVAFAEQQAEKAQKGQLPLTAEQLKAVKAGYEANAKKASGLVRPIRFSPTSDTPKPVSRGTKTATVLSMAVRDEGVTLFELSEALSHKGSTVSPSYARTWVSPSYFASRGYGIRSSVSATEHGPVLRVWAYITNKALESLESGKATEAKPETQDGSAEEEAKTGTNG